jgi:hypothetical protein
MLASLLGVARPLPSIAAAGLASIFAAVALGFLTHAGYAAARAAYGDVDAGLIVAATYAGAAAAVWLVALIARRRAAHRAASRRDDADALLRVLESGDGQTAALAEILKTGRELPPLPMIALALAGGLVAGRRASR